MDFSDPTTADLLCARYWRSYLIGMGALAVAAAMLSHFFLPLEFTDDVWAAALQRLVAISAVALFLERAVEVYVGGSRKIGEQMIRERLAEAEEDRPEDRKGLRAIRRELTFYKLETQRIVFLTLLVGGVLVAATGLRVLSGLIELDDATLRRVPRYWQTEAWLILDTLLTGGVIGGGSAGIHQLIKRFSSGGGAPGP